MAAATGVVFAGAAGMAREAAPTRDPARQSCPVPSASCHRSGARVTWLPAEPGQGSAVIVIVHPDTAGGRHDPVDSVMGMLAGQPLHFVRRPDGRFWALSGIPIDSRASLPLTMTLVREIGRAHV